MKATEAQAVKDETRTTPREQGYKMPAEWEPHEATWLTWPQNRETWPKQLEQVERTYLELITLLSGQEKVHILVNTEETGERVTRMLQGEGVKSSRIFLDTIETDDAWLRDNGPVFIVRKEKGHRKLGLIDWEFNSWGKKYPPWDKDNAVPAAIASKLKISAFKSQQVLEGGSIDVNGKGTCLTTESCLLIPTRNPGSNRAEIEMTLGDYLGVTHVVWLGKGLMGDDTDGHIDTIARFVNPGTVVAALEEDSGNPNYVPLRENFNRLRKAVDQDGKTFEVVALPTPPAVKWNRMSLPASYVNFYIANGLVVVPTFGHRNDRRVMKILGEVLPGRKVVGIDARELLVGLGTFHCITQQQPSVKA